MTLDRLDRRLVRKIVHDRIRSVVPHAG